MSASAAAFRLNERFRVKRPGQLDFDDVAMALGILVKTGGVKGLSARLVRKGNEGIIRINPRIREAGAKRFVVCHELGHWELHEGESQSFLCSADNLRDYKSDPREAEANIFAAELLMPKFLFRPRIEKLDPSLDLIGDIAEEFGVSLTATAIRFMHLSKRDCIVALIKNGRVEWAWKKDDFRRAYLQKGQAIGHGSVAWELENSEIASTEPCEVDPSAWFSHMNYQFHGELQEHSIKMPGYGAILTLLWVP